MIKQYAYQCPKCGNTTFRIFEKGKQKQWIKSYCAQTETMTRIMLMYKQSKALNKEGEK